MNYIGRSHAILIALLITAMGWSQGKLVERPCCPGEKKTPGPTVYTLTAIKDTSAATADLAVDMIATKVTEEGLNYVLRVRIFNGGDDCASTCNKAIVLLPTETKLGEVKHKGNWKQCFGYLELDLRKLCPKGEKSPFCPPEGLTDPLTGEKYWYDQEFEVTVAMSSNVVGKCTPAFAVFVRSEVPDHVPQNNYWWWNQRCVGSSWSPNETHWGPKP